VRSIPLAVKFVPPRLGSAFDDGIFYAECVCSTFLIVKPFLLINFFLLISLFTNHAATVASYAIVIFFLHDSVHGPIGLLHWATTMWANQ
jgi:hypothetical protein